MRPVLVILILLLKTSVIAQFNNMDATFISGKNIERINASYAENDDQPPQYQIYYKFDTLGRIIQSTTSDDIETNYRYIDSTNICITTKINRDVGNKIITYSKGWQKMKVLILNSVGDSIIHRLTYDTLEIDGVAIIECYDILSNTGDTAFRQIFDLNGNLLRYEIVGNSGAVIAHYKYEYDDGRLVYTEFYEGDKFVYKEKISYHQDSNIRKSRVSVPGDGMFSDQKNSYSTEYIVDDQGMLIQEFDFLGEDLNSVTVYTYQFFDPEKRKKEGR